jgi:hypothetical protein
MKWVKSVVNPLTYFSTHDKLLLIFYDNGSIKPDKT